MDRDLMAELANYRIIQWIAEERARMERASPPTPPEQRVVTISREYGAGGHAVAELAAGMLGDRWSIWDREIVDEVARSARVRTSLISALDERAHSRLQELLQHLSNRWELAPEHYYRHLAEVIVALSQQGDKIIIGRGANFLLRSALRVRLCASQSYRVKEIMRREDVSEEAARTRIARTEAERARFVQAFFHRNVNDPSEYDIVVHVDRVGIGPAAASIAAAMEMRRAKAAPAVTMLANRMERPS